MIYGDFKDATPTLPDELLIDSDVMAQVEHLTIALNRVIAYLKAQERTS